MNSQPQYAQPVGTFICNHVGTDDVQNLDKITAKDFDVRQIAAERLIREFNASNIAYTSDTFEDVVNENPSMAKSALHFARLDAVRARRGDGRHGPSTKAPRNLSIEGMSTPHMDCYGEQSETLFGDAATDPTTENEFHHVELSEDLRLFFETCNKDQQRAILLMAKIQADKAEGKTISQSDRLLLTRLRRKVGWELNPTRL